MLRHTIRQRDYVAVRRTSIHLPSSLFRSRLSSQQTTSSKPLKLQWMGLILSCTSLWYAGWHSVSGLHIPLLPPPNRHTSPSARIMFLFSVVTLPVRTSAEDVPELGVEEDMWAKGEGSNTWIRETAQWGASLTFTDHQVSSGIIRYHQISGIIRYYQVSSGIIRYRVSSGIIRYYQVSSDIGYHQVLSGIIRYH